MESFLAGLGISGVTALGVMAYRHPRAYARIAMPLLLLMTACYVSAGIWDQAVATTAAALSPHIESNDASRVAQIIEDLRPNYGIATALMGGGTFLIFFFLWLPDLLKTGEEEGKSRPKGKAQEKDET